MCNNPNVIQRVPMEFSREIPVEDGCYWCLPYGWEDGRNLVPEALMLSDGDWLSPCTGCIDPTEWLFGDEIRWTREPGKLGWREVK
jgi:hypothetical protein